MLITGGIILSELAVVIAELIALAIAGFVLGKILHKIFVFMFGFFSKSTATTLDDEILKAVEGPLELVTIILSVYVFSGYLNELGELRSLIGSYSLSLSILLFAYLLAEVVGAVLRWYYFEGSSKSRLKMDVTLLPFFRKFSKIFILLLGIVSALAVVGIDLTGVLAVTSVVALILGLASQETLANIFAGMALQLDRPFRYGDYLKFSTDEVFKLEKIGTRSTKLSDLNGNTLIISNSEFAKQRIINLSKPTNDFKTSIQVDVLISFEHKELEAYLNSKLKPTKTINVSIEKIGKDSLSLSVSFWVTSFEKLSETKNEINNALLEKILKKRRAE